MQNAAEPLSVLQDQGGRPVRDPRAADPAVGVPGRGAVHCVCERCGAVLWPGGVLAACSVGSHPGRIDLGPIVGRRVCRTMCGARP